MDCGTPRAKPPEREFEAHFWPPPYCARAPFRSGTPRLRHSAWNLSETSGVKESVSFSSKKSFPQTKTLPNWINFALSVRGEQDLVHGAARPDQRASWRPSNPIVAKGRHHLPTVTFGRFRFAAIS